MKPRILIAYATRAGATREVAEFIGRVLREADAEVDVDDVRHIHVMRPYTHVILGTPIRHGHIIPETMNFARRFRAELASRPTAYFVTCMTLAEDTPANRERVNRFLDPLRRIKEPISVGLFAGKMDRNNVEPLWRFLLQYVHEGPMAGGDYRDWDEICAWANELVQLMVKDRVYA